jgi:aryl-alcohol dehydrogenase-like predicted oxidoreductase
MFTSSTLIGTNAIHKVKPGSESAHRRVETGGQFFYQTAGIAAKGVFSMKYRILGKTGLNVSVVGVGTWQFGGEWGEAFSQPVVNGIIDKARQVGINLIDTAECYGDHLSESLVGTAIHGERHKWVIATKFGHQFHGNFNRTDHWSAAEVTQSLEASLKALQTDYVDLYQFHSGSNAAFDNPELWQALEKLVQTGKVRFVGLSISPNSNLYQVERASTVGAGTIQVVYNRLDTLPEEQVFPSCLQQNLGVLARVPLASGFLSGKYKPGKSFTDPDDVRSRRNAAQNEAQLRQVETIRQTEVPAGMDMAAWALAWCLRHPAVTCVIPGCKNPAQVEANARAVA